MFRGVLFSSLARFPIMVYSKPMARYPLMVFLSPVARLLPVDYLTDKTRFFWVGSFFLVTRLLSLVFLRILTRSPTLGYFN